MKSIAIIPARSGSKGLKNKNILDLCGKPLMAYTIEAAIESGIFDTVHVSTDSEEYAEIARKYGADVPFLRSAEASGDTTNSWVAVREVLDRYKELGSEYDVLTLLQPTSPFRGAEDIRAAYEKLIREKVNGVVSVCEVDHSPVFCHPLKEDGEMSDFAIKDKVRRQDYDTYYRVNGAMYFLRTDYFDRVERNVFHDGVHAYVMSKNASIDIDDRFDMDIAEAIMRKRNG